MVDLKGDLKKRVAELQDEVQLLRDALVAIHVYATPREGDFRRHCSVSIRQRNDGNSMKLAAAYNFGLGC